MSQTTITSAQIKGSPTVSANNENTAQQPTAGVNSVNRITTLLTEFKLDVTGAENAMVISADGFALAAAEGASYKGSEQLAAVVAGMTSLATGAADLVNFGELHQVIVEMDGGYFFIMAANESAVVGAVANDAADLGSVGYELTLLTDKVANLLNPALIEQLKSTFLIRSSDNHEHL